jgi:DNA-binding LytR/AlgR family response regulator
MRVHRSFIVPLNRIDTVRNKTIYLGEVKIPVGVSYEEEFFTRFKP